MPPSTAASESPSPTKSSPPPRRSAWSGAIEYAGMLIVLFGLVLIFSSLSDRFLHWRTLTTIANQVPDLTVIAVGMTFVLIVGGIDLSVGSILALSSVVLGVAMVDGQWPLWGAVAACLLTGTLCGMANGMISVWASIPSFIVTLGMLEIARGGAYMVANSQTKFIGSAVEQVATPLPGLQLSTTFLIAVAVVLFGQWLLSRTLFGRYCVAIGTNTEAVRMSGINDRPYRIIVFSLLGLLCGLGGWMQTARLATADPNAAVGLELSAIAAAVIGGTSLMGGRGSVINTFFGVLIIAVLQTGLAQVGASEPIKRMITGGVIILAVLLDAWRNQFYRSLPGLLNRLRSRKNSTVTDS
ncbi:Ribose transport system permease protein RbsC [Planctomycetales bacterium 10988]|nr:Ribose transport system permease protein RbsC [Planctomycetales bacterium 10988]